MYLILIQNPYGIYKYNHLHYVYISFALGLITAKQKLRIVEYRINDEKCNQKGQSILTSFLNTGIIYFYSDVTPHQKVVFIP